MAGCFDNSVESSDDDKCCHADVSGGATTMTACTFFPSLSAPFTYQAHGEDAAMDSIDIFLAFPTDPQVGDYTGDQLDTWSATYLQYATDNWTAAGGTSAGGTPYGTLAVHVTSINTLMGKKVPTGTAEIQLVNMKMPPKPPVAVHLAFGP
jgi:hypothetical protein